MFNDLVIVCKQRRHEQYQCRNFFPLLHVLPVKFENERKTVTVYNYVRIYPLILMYMYMYLSGSVNSTSYVHRCTLT